MNRRADIDAVRALGLLLVLIAHSAVGLVPWAPRVGTYQPNMTIGVLTMWGGLWVMPLFFTLAGATAAFSLDRRENRAYLSERIHQLLIPLIVMMIVLVIPTLYVGRRMFGDQLSFASFVSHFFDGIWPDGNFGLLHLWFIAYLFIDGVVALPVMRWLSVSRGRAMLGTVARIIEKPGGILLLSLPVIACDVALSGRFPQPVLPAIVNDVTGLVRSFILLVLGFVLFREPRLQRAIERQWKLAGIVAVLSSLPTMLLATVPGFDPSRTQPTDYSLAYVSYWATGALAGWAWIICVLGGARRLFSAPRRWITRTRGWLFPFYVLHQFVVGSVMILVGQIVLPAAVSILANVAIALPITLGLCWLVERSSVTRHLFGMPSPIELGVMTEDAALVER